MKAVVQRVSRASVEVDGAVVGEIGIGFLLLLGVERGDARPDARVLAKKIAGLRIFPGDKPMDRSLADVSGSVLVVSQFTLAADVKKGRRPGFERAAAPKDARALYEGFCDDLRALDVPVQTGTFQAHMDVRLCNDGPVTLIVTARNGSIE